MPVDIARQRFSIGGLFRFLGNLTSERESEKVQLLKRKTCHIVKKGNKKVVRKIKVTLTKLN